ncbi:hypothetical protein TNCV_5125921 [Trichonephila clavipes]|nr:hypothetical protein TNCV_5125921 [Trichonephila clavipes]
MERNETEIRLNGCQRNESLIPKFVERKYQGGWDEKMDGDSKAKLAVGTVGFEAGVSLFTDPISDVVKCI